MILDPRLRQPVHAAHRAARPRAARLLRDPSLRRAARRRIQRLRARGHHPLGRPGERLRTRARRCPTAPMLLDVGVPVLGICYGMHVLNHAFGGGRWRAPTAARVRAGRHHDRRRRPDLLRRHRRAARRAVWMSHGDRMDDAWPPGSRRSRTSDNSPLAAFRHRAPPLYGVQFHPEVTHTAARAARSCANFLFRVCERRARLDDGGLRRDARSPRIRAQVGERRVICGALRRRRLDRRRGAHPPRHRRPAHLHLRRQRRCCAHGEAEQVVDALPRPLRRSTSASSTPRARFLDDLAGVDDPEQKRTIIGGTFIEVFEDEAKTIPRRRASSRRARSIPTSSSRCRSRARRPPSRATTTSAACPSACSSSSSSRCASSSRTRCARSAACSACPTTIVGAPAVPRPRPRHPHPRRGRPRSALVDPARRRHDRRQEEIRAAGLYDTLWQAFAVLLPVKTVGVMGDERTYENVVAIRAVRVDRRHDRRLGAPARRPARARSRAASSTRSRGVNRVVYDISSKPPATIEWE